MICVTYIQLDGTPGICYIDSPTEERAKRTLALRVSRIDWPTVVTHPASLEEMGEAAELDLPVYLDEFDLASWDI